ncbi:unnamed protein product [marine sediment metagenome]|uniref:Uncharacterized protein n=1 Tax=marine sediment metagenome TaxID=412755 RepID=X1ESN0_9ZZZZ
MFLISFPSPALLVQKYLFETWLIPDQLENKAEQKIIIDMLSDIQNALVKANKKFVQLPENKINFLGNLKIIVKHADSVTGVEITDSAKNVEFKSGTNIQIKGDDVKKITGVKIGKDNNS